MTDRLVVRTTLFALGIVFVSFIATSVIMLIASTVEKHEGSSRACIAPPANFRLNQPAPSLFIYSFNVPGVLNEAPGIKESTSPYWFLDSGGRLIINNGIGTTIRGPLPAGDRWHDTYARSNPRDTDDGTHPQNIFRLVSIYEWENVSEEVWFRIAGDNFSASPNRNQSNGLFLMSRYCDSDNLYYAGIRVDGTAVIKKKYAGIYYTVAQTPLFSGSYNARENPNLLPHESWLALKSVTETGVDGTVFVRLYMKASEESPWKLVASAADHGEWGGTPPILRDGQVGIRTDFMDVQFKNIRIEAL